MAVANLRYSGEDCGFSSERRFCTYCLRRCCKSGFLAFLKTCKDNWAVLLSSGALRDPVNGDGGAVTSVNDDVLMAGLGVFDPPRSLLVADWTPSGSDRKARACSSFDTSNPCFARRIPTPRLKSKPWLKRVHMTH